MDFYATFRFLHFTCWVFSSLWLLLMRPLFGGDNFLNALKFCMYLVWMLSYAFSTMYYLQTFSQLMPCHKLLLVGSHSNIPSKLVCDGLGCNNIIIQFNRYPANVPEKNLKKKRKELLWGSRLSSYKIECTEQGVKLCTIQLTHRAPKRRLELVLPCNGSASTYTATSRRLLPAPITERFLKFKI